MTSTGLVGGAASASVQNAQDIAVLKQALDTQKAEGRAAVSLIQTAGQVQAGSGVGAAEPGKGARVDVRA